jgi:hypothetical protein
MTAPIFGGPPPPPGTVGPIIGGPSNSSGIPLPPDSVPITG